MFETIEPNRAAYAIDAPHPLSTLVRAVIVEGQEDVVDLADSVESLYPYVPEQHRRGVAIAIYQPGNRRILIVRSRKEFLENLFDALQAVRRHARFAAFDISATARVQFDFFHFAKRDVRFGSLSAGSLDDGHFEFGLDGLRVRTATNNHYFLPGDSYVGSILGIGQLRRYLVRTTGVADIDNCVLDLIRSTSFVSFGDRWLRLYRGHPVLREVSVQDVEQVCDRAVKHIITHFRADGRFLYYYDAAGDSHRDHEHPKRNPEEDPYYNELRHCGGIVALLLSHSRRAEPSVLPIVEQAIDFIVRISSTYKTADGRVARHLVYNRKSKLGSAGLALYSLALYHRLPAAIDMPHSPLNSLNILFLKF